jgi:Protein of unknown function (DUF2911)
VSSLAQHQRAWNGIAKEDAMNLRMSVLAVIASTALIAPVGWAQTSGGKQMASPAATASVQLNGKQVTIDYHTPSMRGRKIFGELLPYGQVWRTGANQATALKTETNLKIGTADVPAGNYTLYTLPSQGTWKLIINKQTGQWGTKYDQSQDLARVDMRKNTLPSPQEKMSISFENTQGNRTQLHVRWDTTDVWVPVAGQ